MASANTDFFGFINISESSTTTTTKDLPANMKFNDSHMIAIISYGILLLVSGVANTAVMVTLCQRYKRRKTKISLMIIHLAIADLFVTFLNMPLEIAWKLTVTWNAGDFMCRFMSFFRIFGLYLSSYVLICISIDRYSAVKYPLHVQQTHLRTTWMLSMAWIAAALCSAPQVIFFV